MSRKNKYRVVK